MSDDLILGEGEEEVEYEGEYTSPIEFISAAYYSMAAVDDLDMQIMNETERRRVKRIRWKSIKMIDYALSMLYDELFDDSIEE